VSSSRDGCKVEITRKGDGHRKLGRRERRQSERLWVCLRLRWEMRKEKKRI
jgi:hypothetical protein